MGSRWWNSHGVHFGQEYAANARFIPIPSGEGVWVNSLKISKKHSMYVLYIYTYTHYTRTLQGIISIQGLSMPIGRDEHVTRSHPGPPEPNRPVPSSVNTHDLPLFCKAQWWFVGSLLVSLRGVVWWDVPLETWLSWWSGLESNFITHPGSMGWTVYLATFTIKINQM